MRIKDITGQKFNFLTALSFVGKTLGKSKTSIWLFKCDCGIEKEIIASSVKNDSIKSCGCKKNNLIRTARSTQPMFGSPEYISWKSMKSRCDNPKNPDYENYGGKGVTYDPSWSKFEAFYADMGDRPEGLTLDRRDGESNYTVANCRWATAVEQSSNKRTSRFVEFKGEQMTLAEFGRRIGLDRRLVRHRIVNKGQSPEEVARGALCS